MQKIHLQKGHLNKNNYSCSKNHYYKGYDIISKKRLSQYNFNFFEVYVNYTTLHNTAYANLACGFYPTNMYICIKIITQKILLNIRIFSNLIPPLSISLQA